MVFKTDYYLMQVKSIAECSKEEHSAILLTFIKLLFVIEIFVLSSSGWPLKTDFTVNTMSKVFEGFVSLVAAHRGFQFLLCSGFNNFPVFDP